jgi:hypothetical protein
MGESNGVANLRSESAQMTYAWCCNGFTRSAPTKHATIQGAQTAGISWVMNPSGNQCAAVRLCPEPTARREVALTTIFNQKEL